MQKYEFVVGCDMSKAFYDVAYFVDNQASYQGQYDNDHKGFTKWLRSLKKIAGCSPDRWLVVFENTGSYSKLFKYWLLSNQIPCVEASGLEVKANAPTKRGKSDPIDAKMICEFGYEKQYKLTPSRMPNEVCEKLKVLLSRRALLVKQKKGLKVSVNERKMILAEDIADLLVQQNQVLIQCLDKQIKDLEALMISLLKTTKELSKNFKLIQTIPGIGPVTATTMIVHTENFRSFTSARKFASYAAIAPFPNSSGIRNGRNKTSKKGNKKIKALLSNCVVCAIQHDPCINQYVQRLQSKNKQKKVIMNNVKNKLVQRIFAVVKRQQPYVKLAYQ